MLCYLQFFKNLRGRSEGIQIYFLASVTHSYPPQPPDKEDAMFYLEEKETGSERAFLRFVFVPAILVGTVIATFQGIANPWAIPRRIMGKLWEAFLMFLRSQFP